MKNLHEILKIEQSISNMIEDLKTQIIDDISGKPLDDVTTITKNICIVKLSKLRKDVWSPEYYLPYKQAEYVGHAIKDIPTIHSFISKISEIIKSEYVKIGQNKYRLNDATLSILQKYLGETKNQNKEETK